MSALPNGTPIANGLNLDAKAPYDPHANDHGAQHGGAVRADAYHVPSWSSKLSTNHGMLQARTNMNGEASLCICPGDSRLMFLFF